MLFHSFHYQNDCLEIVSGIDEVQFFYDNHEMCDPLTMAGEVVIVAALTGNPRRERRKIINVPPQVESIRMLIAVCGMRLKEKSNSTRH